ncbi:MAG: hypothetical protein QOF70_2580 [Acetobacteraceae bacterium]|jgi:ornithine cyclodeaminase/alanine dehydrogenase-like protein (mu-crystallin family)|nr:hypothetical protein [Acetobacteraceae bacterium]
MDERLDDALSKIRLLTDRLQRLEQRNAFLATELKREEQNHTNKIKEVIVLKQQQAQAEQRPKNRTKPDIGACSGFERRLGKCDLVARITATTQSFVDLSFLT